MRSIRLAVLPFLLAAFACSGSPAAPTPQPTPTPTPAPTPTPTPQPTPTPDCGGCEPPVTNANPPARLTIRVYKVVDKNEVLQPLTERDLIPVGFKVTVDATAKDADERETNGISGWVAYFVSDEDVVNVGGNHPFQRKLTGLKEGTVEVWAKLDGVRSNTLVLRFGSR